MDITFDSICVTSKSGQKILDNVCGKASLGKLTSLMGCSGSGKTTLLTCLARRFDPSLKYTGTVFYGNQKWSSKQKRKVIAFVSQDDIVPEYLTVAEYLQFSGALRLGGLLSSEEISERIERIIKQLRLEKCRNTKLGGIDQRGISGGEKKRSSIANELLTQPKVLLCDEPTSGLDSTLSVVVVEILRELAQSGITVLTTIHSPSSAIFTKFDYLYILDQGMTFFSGEADTLVSFLQTKCEISVPPHFNPADMVMDVLVLDQWEEVRKKVKAGLVSNVLVLDQWEEGNKNVKTVDANFSPDMELKEVEFAEEPHEYSLSLWKQIWLLAKRMWKKTRPSFFAKEQIMATLGLSAIAGLLFFQIGHTESFIFSRIALCLWLSGTEMYLSTFSTLFALHDEIPLLKKELFDGSYTLVVHYMAKSLVLFPASSFWCLIFALIVLGCSGLAPNVLQAFYIVLTLQSCIFMFQGVGLFFSAAIPMSTLMTIGVVVVTYFFAFNGFFVPYVTMPAWYQWLRWPCMLVYPFQFVIQLVFIPSETYTCSPTDSSYCTGSETEIYSEQVLETYHVDISMAGCILTVFISGFLFRIAAFLIFQQRMKPARGLNDGEGRRWRIW